MKNIFVIPTDKPSRLGYLTKKGKEVFKDLRLFDTLMPQILDSENQNIYITFDEEIKKGDWFIRDSKLYNEFKTSLTPKVTMFIRLYPHLDLSEQWVEVYIKDCKKIILTTDQDLIKDGVQAINEEFLEWFVKNPSCEEVEVVSELKAFDKHGFCVGVATLKDDYTKNVYYIIPKEEPTIELKDGNQLTHQFEEWNAVFELQSQCRKLGLSELEMHSVLSNKFELKQK